MGRYATSHPTDAAGWPCVVDERSRLRRSPPAGGEQARAAGGEEEPGAGFGDGRRRGTGPALRVCFMEYVVLSLLRRPVRSTCPLLPHRRLTLAAVVTDAVLDAAYVWLCQQCRSPAGLDVAKQTLDHFVARVRQLYEREPGEGVSARLD